MTVLFLDSRQALMQAGVVAIEFTILAVASRLSGELNSSHRGELAT